MNYIVRSMDGTEERLNGGMLKVEQWGNDPEHPEAVLVWRAERYGSPSMPSVGGDWYKSWPLVTIKSWERAT